VGGCPFLASQRGEVKKYRANTGQKQGNYRAKTGQIQGKYWSNTG